MPIIASMNEQIRTRKSFFDRWPVNCKTCEPRHSPDASIDRSAIQLILLVGLNMLHMRCLLFVTLIPFGAIFGCSSHSKQLTEQVVYQLIWEGYEWQDDSSEQDVDFYINDRYIGTGAEGLRMCCVEITTLPKGSVLHIRYDDVPQTDGHPLYRPPFSSGYSLWDVIEAIAESREIVVSKSPGGYDKDAPGLFGD